MKTSRFTDSQILAILKQAGTGRPPRAKRLLQSFQERAFPVPRSLSCIVGKFDWQSVPERCVDLCDAVNGRLNVVPDGNHVIDPELVQRFWGSEC